MVDEPLIFRHMINTESSTNWTICNKLPERTFYKYQLHECVGFLTSVMAVPEAQSISRARSEEEIETSESIRRTTLQGILGSLLAIHTGLVLLSLLVPGTMILSS